MNSFNFNKLGILDNFYVCVNMCTSVSNNFDAC
jgi:hypothetical protein